MPSLSPPFPIINDEYRMKAEPIVRIGVVLAEDKKKNIVFSLPSDGYTLEVAGHEPLNASGLNNPLQLQRRVDGDFMDLRDAEGRIIQERIQTLRVVPPAQTQPLAPGDGVLVKDMVAGRGFHWAKLIDQTLSHTLEFIAREDAIIVVNELPIETYLTGVITGEMSGECPIEFMKAQAIAARSWLLGQPRPPHPGQPYLWCNDDCCQRYQGTGGWSPRAIEAIRQCRGEVLITRSNRYCDARYSKSTGGISEDADFVWAEPIEGLVARVDAPADDATQRFFPVTEENLDEYLSGDWLKTTGAYASPNVVPEDSIKRYLGRVDEIGEYFRWTKELTQASLQESLTKRAGITDLAEVLDLVPGKRGRSGRLGSLDVIYRSTSGEKKTFTLTSEYKIRAGLSMKFLYSGAFKVTITRDANGRLEKANLLGAGWGHGAGLCQIGGLGRALKGQKYDEILLAYYSDVRLERIYD